MDFLTSPVFIAMIWPITFVLIEILSTLDDKPVARGEEKYQVWYQKDGPDDRPHSGPETLEGILTLVAEGKKVIDIERLADNFWDKISFGADLCIGALATDLALAFATNFEDPVLARSLIPLFVIHLAIFMFVVSLLKYSKPHTAVIWSANLIGATSIIAPFIFFGRLIVQ